MGGRRLPALRYQSGGGGNPGAALGRWTAGTERFPRSPLAPQELRPSGGGWGPAVRTTQRRGSGRRGPDKEMLRDPPRPVGPRARVRDPAPARKGGASVGTHCACAEGRDERGPAPAAPAQRGGESAGRRPRPLRLRRPRRGVCERCARAPAGGPPPQPPPPPPPDPRTRPPPRPEASARAPCFPPRPRGPRLGRAACSSSTRGGGDGGGSEVRRRGRGPGRRAGGRGARGRPVTGGPTRVPGAARGAAPLSRAALRVPRCSGPFVCRWWTRAAARPGRAGGGWRPRPTAPWTSCRWTATTRRGPRSPPTCSGSAPRPTAEVGRARGRGRAGLCAVSPRAGLGAPVPQVRRGSARPCAPRAERGPVRAGVPGRNPCDPCPSPVCPNPRCGIP